MTTIAAPLAALLLGLSTLSVSCSQKPKGLYVRIAGIGRCEDNRNILLEVLPKRGLKLNGEDQKRDELERRLKDIFKTRVYRYVYVIGDPNVSFGEVAEVIGIAAKQADYVSIVIPSVMKQATYRGESCRASDHRKDTCLDAN